MEKWLILKNLYSFNIKEREKNMKKILISLLIIVVCLVGLCVYAKMQNSTTTKDGIKVAPPRNDGVQIENTNENTNESNSLNSQEKYIKVKETILLNDSKKIILDIDQKISDIKNINTYKYEIKPIDNDVRTNLFVGLFGNRSSMMKYDERNNVWELRNSDSLGDYWLYHLTYSNGGLTMPGETAFAVSYRKPNLNPLDSNQKKNIINIGISKETAIELCDEIIKSIDPDNRYKVDFVHMYGNGNGSNLFYWINYKKIINEMPVTAYNDLYFFVDKNGIERVYGALYNINDEKNISIITVDEAIQNIKNNSISISANKIEMSENTIYVNEISLEYIVSNDNAEIIPIWRFNIGLDSEERNLYRDRILAINAITGELLQERREKTF